MLGLVIISIIRCMHFGVFWDRLRGKLMKLILKSGHFFNINTLIYFYLGLLLSIRPVWCFFFGLSLNNSFSLLDDICFIEAFHQIQAFLSLDILIKIYLIGDYLVFYGAINSGKRLESVLTDRVRKIRNRSTAFLVFFLIRHINFMNIIWITENSDLNNNHVPLTVV